VPKRHVTKGAAIGTAAALICAVTALAAAGAIRSPFARDRPVREHGTISPTLVKHFAVFTRHLSEPSSATFRGRSASVRQATVAQVPLPQAVSENVHSSYELVLGAAEYVSISTLPSVKTWLIPGASGECIVSENLVGPGVADSTCGSDAVAASGTLIKYSWTPSGVPEFIGLAPNGVTSVSVAEGTGASRSIPVEDNIYAVAGGDPAKIKVTGASGETSTEMVPGLHTPAPVPPSQP
jgi:hypothetical protein